MPTILITGSAGYIGSHTLLKLFSQRYNVVCIDNGLNSYKNRIYKNISQISGKKRISRYSLNLMTDKKELDEVFDNHAIDYCIHFAALKSVSESIKNPLLYYQNNLISKLNLLECFEKYNIKGMIFSSSETVYSPNQQIPLTETSRVGINLTNPYAKTKYFIEQIVEDFTKAHEDFQCVTLRYFNPIGSHKSRLLDENLKGEPQNLMPNILQVLNGDKEVLNIYGDDYPTADGTCVRDFIHVEDLAYAHVKALQKIMHNKLLTKYSIYNVGTGQGTTVMQIINTLQKCIDKKINYEIKSRCPGDLAVVYCDNTKIKKELDWEPQFTIEDALKNYK